MQSVLVHLQIILLHIMFFFAKTQSIRKRTQHHFTTGSCSSQYHPKYFQIHVLIDQHPPTYLIWFCICKKVRWHIYQLQRFLRHSIKKRGLLYCARWQEWPKQLTIWIRNANEQELYTDGGAKERTTRVVVYFNI